MDKKRWAAYMRRWNKRNWDKVRRSRMKRQFGLTMEEWETLNAAQEGKCAICRGRNKDRRLAVDHDHSTQVVRGLLCGRCNRAIGYLKDSPKLARKLATYLEAHARKV